MEQALEQPTLVPVDPPGVQEAWAMVTSQLRMEMKRALYESWVDSLQPVSYNEGVFRVSAVNNYGREWVESHLRSRITGLLQSVYNRPLTVQFSVSTGSAGSRDRARDTRDAREAVSSAVTEAAAPETTRKRSERKQPTAEEPVPGEDETKPSGSPRKIQLQRAYGTARARVIQPERGMFLTLYFFNNWLPLIGHSSYTTILAASSLCYWNPLTGELRNVVETDMAELARRASVSVRTVKDVLQNDLVRRYFLRYKVRRVMTPNGIRTAGIVLQVRMDDPLTPEDQDKHSLEEEERWYTADFEDESEE
jgi:hypothetical protein